MERYTQKDFIEKYNLSRSVCEYSLNNISYGYEASSSRAYKSNMEPEDSKLIKVTNMK